ncbi:MAG: FkbM family methyltransferase, partial [Pirellulaceae bacterium]|nr:FkbM family methyltransferase [Pirellulaceae bacterium]
LLAGQKVKTVFDVGANTGETALYYRRLFPETTVYSFEPFPVTFQELQTKAANDRLIIPLQLALAEKEEIKTFYSFENHVTNSLLPFSKEAGAYVEGMDDLSKSEMLQVQSTSLDLFCQENGIDIIDLLKLDVQGGEGKVIEGGQEILTKKKVRAIISEVDFVSVYEGQTWAGELLQMFAEYGYHLYDFYNFAYSETGQVKWGDAIFLPR